MRNIQLINITNKDLVLSLTAVKKTYAEVDYCLNLISEQKTRELVCLVQYSYCYHTNFLFRIIGIGNDISIEQVGITKAGFDNLYHLYSENFVRFDDTYQQINPADFEGVKKVWEKIFMFFFNPLEIYLTDVAETIIFISITDIYNKSYIYDLATIFDLQYRFFHLPQNTNKYILSVAGLRQYEFVENILGLFKPIAKKTVILYGFDQHYTESALAGSSDQLKELALAREQVYQVTLQNGRKAGALVVELEHVDQIKMYLQKEWEGFLVQIVTHYEYNEIQKDSRLFFKKKSIRFDLLMKMIGDLFHSHKIRNDVIIDAITCSNFFDLKNLYRLGIKYLNLSHHDIDTDLAAFYLNELFTGVNAEMIGWEPNYLTGQQHLYQVKSNISRCFFSITKSGALILTP